VTLGGEEVVMPSHGVFVQHPVSDPSGKNPKQAEGQHGLQSPHQDDIRRITGQ